MEIVSTEKHADGSVTITVDVSDEEEQEMNDAFPHWEGTKGELLKHILVCASKHFKAEK